MKYTILVVITAMCALLVGAALAAEAPAPLYVSNRDLGGGALNQYTPGVAGGTGVNNIGLLIRTYGKVTYVDTANQFFYIDDGCGRTDGTKRADNSIVLGVRVSYGGLASGVAAVIPPAENTRVAITGIISTCMVSTLVRPNVRVRHQDDILSIL